MDIGRGLSGVLEVDCKAILSGQARFLRLWVEIPPNKPLHKGGLVVSLEGNKVLVAFKYERLNGLCFNCGLLGHNVHTRISAGDQAHMGSGSKQAINEEASLRAGKLPLHHRQELQKLSMKKVGISHNKLPSRLRLWS
nr:hypothetical protein CFP56_71135 [Quercus suber]